MPTANKACMCNRCGRFIDKGEPIRFETYQTRGHRKTGSGRHTGGGATAYRPIHLHDCDGWDAAQARAKSAALAARS